MILKKLKNDLKIAVKHSMIFTCFLLSFTIMARVFTEDVKAADTRYEWNEEKAPNYIKVIGKAKTSKVKKGKIVYSKLDKYKRPGKVKGCITYQMVKKSAGWREDITVNPAGWPTKNFKASIPLYNGKTYNGWFWNRSHLIADSLGGKAIKENLITGTRMQNVSANDGTGGMAYTERKAVNWIYKHKKGTVYYAATPVYKSNEKIPRSVIVDIKTSDGTINERVIVYNAAKQYKIDYKTGKVKQLDIVRKIAYGTEGKISKSIRSLINHF